MAQWEEYKHPRDNDGKFTSGGGSQSGGTPAEHRRLQELGIESESDYVKSLHKALSDPKWESSLTPSQKGSIRWYTAYSNRINNLLRGERGDCDKNVWRQIIDIDKAIDDYELKEPITVYRRVPNVYVKRDFLKEKAFSSCSISKEFALRIARHNNKDCIYVYDLPATKGTGAYINNLADPTHRDNELEFLIGRGVPFKEVDSFVENGILFIKWRIDDD